MLPSLSTLPLHPEISGLTGCTSVEPSDPVMYNHSYMDGVDNKVNVEENEDNTVQVYYDQYSFDDPFTFGDFIMMYNLSSYTADTYTQALNKARSIIMPDMSRVLRAVSDNTIVYYAKISSDLPYKTVNIDRHGRYDSSMITIKYKEKEKPMSKELPLFHFAVDKYSISIRSESINSIPFTREILSLKQKIRADGTKGSLKYVITDNDKKYDRKVFNIFPGFKARLIPVDGRSKDEYRRYVSDKIQKLLNHIMNGWCSSNHEWFDYIIKWFMVPLVELKKTEIMLTLMGGQGCGKSMVFEFIRKYVTGYIITGNAVTLAKLTGDFNEMLINKMFMFIDEAPNTSNDFSKVTADSQILKGLVTGTTINISEKYKNTVTVNNVCSFALTTNSEVPLRIDPDDRRNAVFKCVGPSSENKRDYFETLAGTFNQEAGDAFYTLLHIWKLADGAVNKINLSNIPKTEVRTNIIIGSKLVGFQFFIEIFTGELCLDATKVIKVNDMPCIKLSDYYNMYKIWHARTNNGKLWSEVIFNREAKSTCFAIALLNQRSGSKKLGTDARGTVFAFTDYEDIKVDRGRKNIISLAQYIEEDYGLKSPPIVYNPDDDSD